MVRFISFTASIQGPNSAHTARSLLNSYHTIRHFLPRPSAKAEVSCYSFRVIAVYGSAWLPVLLVSSLQPWPIFFTLYYILTVPHNMIKIIMLGLDHFLIPIKVISSHAIGIVLFRCLRWAISQPWLIHSPVLTVFIHESRQPSLVYLACNFSAGLYPMTNTILLPFITSGYGLALKPAYSLIRYIYL